MTIRKLKKNHWSRSWSEAQPKVLKAHNPKTKGDNDKGGKFGQYQKDKNKISDCQFQ
jgi:hypothetical protein